MPDTRKSSRTRRGKEAKENDAMEDGNTEEATITVSQVQEMKMEWQAQVNSF